MTFGDNFISCSLFVLKSYYHICILWQPYWMHFIHCLYFVVGLHMELLFWTRSSVDTFFVCFYGLKCSSMSHLLWSYRALNL